MDGSEGDEDCADSADAVVEEVVAEEAVVEVGVVNVDGAVVSGFRGLEDASSIRSALGCSEGLEKVTGSAAVVVGDVFVSGFGELEEGSSIRSGFLESGMASRSSRRAAAVSLAARLAMNFEPAAFISLRTASFRLLAGCPNEVRTQPS